MEDDEPLTVMRTVARRPRPTVCRYLSQTGDGGVSVGELSTHLANHSVTHGQFTGHYDRDRLAIELRHSHLPTLDAIDILDYDSDLEWITPASNLTLTEPILQTLEDLQKETSE